MIGPRQVTEMIKATEGFEPFDRKTFDSMHTVKGGPVFKNGSTFWITHNDALITIVTKHGEVLFSETTKTAYKYNLSLDDLAQMDKHYEGFLHGFDVKDLSFMYALSISAVGSDFIEWEGELFNENMFVVRYRTDTHVVSTFIRPKRIPLR